MITHETIGPEVPKIQLDTRECGYIQHGIATHLSKYTESLSHDAAEAFRNRTKLTQKIDRVCWIWAQNPQTYEQSVDLKSLHVMMTLEDGMVRNFESGRTFDINPEDEYWRLVDQRVYDHYTRIIMHKANTGIMPIESADQTADPEPLCMINDHLLTRQRVDEETITYALLPMETDPTIPADQA